VKETHRQASIEGSPACKPDGSSRKEHWLKQLHEGMRHAAHQPKKGKFRWGADSPEEEHLMDLQLSYVELLKRSISVTYVDEDGHHRTFFPDFRIKGRLIEYKGDHLLRGVHEENAHTSSKLRCIDVGFVPTTLSPLFEYFLIRGNDPMILARRIFALWQSLDMQGGDRAVKNFAKLPLEEQIQTIQKTYVQLT